MLAPGVFWREETVSLNRNRPAMSVWSRGEVWVMRRPGPDDSTRSASD